MATKKINKQVVGIDIGKDKFYACYKTLSDSGKITIKGTKSFDNTALEMDKFYVWCKSRNKSPEIDLVFVMEATGVYYEELAYFLHFKEAKISVQLAQKVKYFAKSCNLKTKTDKVDSKMIAEFGIEKNLSGNDFWTPPSQEFKSIRDLAREHTSMTKSKAAAKQQLHALNYSHSALKEVVELKEKQISFYEQQVKVVEESMTQLIKSDEVFYEKVQKIEKVKGLGVVTIIKILAEVNGFLLFNSIRQLVSYAGLDVIENESGNKKGKTKISKKGNARIRAALYMPAMSAIRSNVPLKAFYERINDGRTNKKQGLVAVMRKLLILIYTLWKKDEEYIENYASTDK